MRRVGRRREHLSLFFALARLEISSAEELASARKSADEAVLARNHKDPFSQGEGGDSRGDQSNMRRGHFCQYPGTECAGCSGEIKKGEPITQAGKGIVHRRDNCIKLAKVKLIEEAASVKAARVSRHNVGLHFLIKNKKWILYYIKLRIEATTLGEENCYVNIAGGTKDGYDLKAAGKWLNKWGFEIFGNVSMGPLLRATSVGNVKLITHMPLASGSTYTYVPKALYEAWEINVNDGVVDTELSLLGEKPKFGNHGNRRKADRVACETMDLL